MNNVRIELLKHRRINLITDEQVMNIYYSPVPAEKGILYLFYRIGESIFNGDKSLNSELGDELCYRLIADIEAQEKVDL